MLREMSTTACNVRNKPSEGFLQKNGPLKATIPVSSLLRPLYNTGSKSSNTSISCNKMLPSINFISPITSDSGHRSPGAVNYHKVKSNMFDTIILHSCMRRTVSLDAIGPVVSPNSSDKTQQTCGYSKLQLDKSTQTDESSISYGDLCVIDFPSDSISSKSDNVSRQKIQKDHQRYGENSVSSQTFNNPNNTSPVFIQPKSCTSHRPMRSSVEGLNQEIEKLVLIPSQQHTCRPESSHINCGIPEGHRAPLADILQSDTRTVNTQTPNRDILSSDGSQSTSPNDNGHHEMSSGSEASPRINRFLARLPPDGCEKVCLKSGDTDRLSPTSKIFKPPAAFKLHPSLGSAFQPIPTAITKSTNNAVTITSKDNASNVSVPPFN